MIRNCRNCAGRVRFDIKSQKIVCDTCSSGFEIGELSAESDKSAEMECDVYVCNSCGAEVVINNTESSTFCPFCGNASVVMSRVASFRRPETIIPFEVTAEDAAKNIKEKFSKGFFIPDLINPSASDLIGIYIPYYVTNVEFNGNMYLASKDSRKINSGYSRGCYASANWVTTDASKKFSDVFSQRLEPYYFDRFRSFDEEYLLGFYSDISDVEEDEAIATARSRVMNSAHDKMINSFTEGRYFRHIYNTQTKFITEVYDKPVTTMLPAWFYTYNYNGTPYTISVNGQTGQVSGGVPWDNKKFAGLVTLFTILIGGVLSLPALLLPADLLILTLAGLVPVLGVVAYFLSNNLRNFGGYKKFFASIRSRNVAASNSLMSYVNKRGGR